MWLPGMMSRQHDEKKTKRDKVMMLRHSYCSVVDPWISPLWSQQLATSPKLRRDELVALSLFIFFSLPPLSAGMPITTTRFFGGGRENNLF